MRHTQSYRKITLAKENAQILKRATKRGLHSSENPEFWKSGEWGPHFVVCFKIACSFVCRRSLG